MCNLSVKVEAKIADLKPNTPRSKHSATEQRRRCKINDSIKCHEPIGHEFDSCRGSKIWKQPLYPWVGAMLHTILPLSDPANASKNNQIAEGFLDHTQTQGGNTNSGRASAFARKFEENRGGVSPSLPVIGQNIVDSDISTATTIKQRGQLPELVHNGTARTAASSPVSPKQQSTDTNTKLTWPPLMKDQKLTVESGTINISSVYSQGLLNTLTQALQTFGVDLSQASISVQIDLGKRANRVQHASTLHAKDDDVPGALPRSRSASAGEEFGHALKRLRTS
ncbi:hypothetical protein OROGR_031116 [Orobanche gracilis]